LQPSWSILFSMAHAAAEREAAFQRGLLAYRAGRHYEAHEHWESIWQIEEDLLQKSFLQGLIQVAAAMHKLLEMKGTAGAVRLLDKARGRLEAVPEGTGGLWLERLLEDMARARAEIERLGAEGRTDLADEFIPRIAAAPR
jgi:uncharacterized protein